MYNWGRAETRSYRKHDFLEDNMTTAQLKAHITAGGLDQVLTHIYGAQALEAQKARYSKAIDEFAAIYGADRDVTLYSVAGRSELSGNHTDHNHGCVDKLIERGRILF